MDPAAIPDKLYFKIGEVADLTGVKPHVLRYWESEFGVFRPSKSRSQQRLYQRKDIELVFRLKELLYQQGFTIAGARKQLRAAYCAAPSAAVTAVAAPQDQRQLLIELRQELQQLRDRLATAPEIDLP